jgi:hypothetical protein
MTLDDLKKEYGNGNKFEIETGLSHTNWFHWFKKYGFIPIHSQLRIEQITKGKLKASLDDIPTRGI